MYHKAELWSYINVMILWLHHSTLYLVKSYSVCTHTLSFWSGFCNSSSLWDFDLSWLEFDLPSSAGELMLMVAALDPPWTAAATWDNEEKHGGDLWLLSFTIYNGCYLQWIKSIVFTLTMTLRVQMLVVNIKMFTKQTLRNQNISLTPWAL